MIDVNTLVTDSKRNASGVQTLTLDSPHQAGPTVIRTWCRTAPTDAGKLLLVLPVQKGFEEQAGAGDSFETVTTTCADQLTDDWLIAAPTFSETPWYANHPTDARVAQERHLLEVVLPLVERRPMKRRLLGMSKSGWGAWSLLLRHPDQFEKACAWDSPLMQRSPDRWDMERVFGDEAAFQPWRIDHVLRRSAARLRRQPPRLSLRGHVQFESHLLATRTLLEELGVPHDYLNVALDKHRWDSGWLESAVRWLVAE